MQVSPLPVTRAVAAVEHLVGSDAEGEEEVEVSFTKSRRESGTRGHPTSATAPTHRDTSGRSGRMSEERGGQEGGGARKEVVVGSTGAAAEGLTLPPPPPHDTALLPPSGAPYIPAVDYADRQRLLFHITQLSMQLQRAHIQLQEQTRVIAILRPAAAAAAQQQQQPVDKSGSSDRHEDGCNNGLSTTTTPATAAAGTMTTTTLKLAGPAESVTAAVLAARTEADLQTAMSSSLALFDPLLAEEAIHRLDSALAQLSVLREAELGRLEESEGELQRLRGGWIALTTRLDELTMANAALEKENTTMRDRFEAIRLEVERLRLEETVLLRKVKNLEALTGEGNLTDGVHVVGAPRGAAAGPDTSGDSLYGSRPQPVSPRFQQQQHTLMLEESLARQHVMLDMFWEPAYIAFDAGLTWVSECEELEAQRRQLQRPPNALHTGRQVGAEAAAAALAPLTDSERTMLQGQRERLAALEAKLTVCQERQRMAQLEADRLRFLYEGEQRRSEALATSHHRQLQLAYDEVVKDRALLTAQLKAEVEEQLRAAFLDGRRYERQRRTRRGGGPAAEVPAEKGAGSAHGPRGHGKGNGRGRSEPRTRSAAPVDSQGLSAERQAESTRGSRPASSLRAASSDSAASSSSAPWQSPR